MSNNNEKPKWSKIVKLFLEFLIAALVAWFGSSCSASARASMDAAQFVPRAAFFSMR